MISDAFSLTVLRLLLVVTVGTCVTVGILAWRERPEPGAIPLSILMTGVCYWATVLFFRLGASELSAKIYWFDAGWPGIVLIPVAWILFALDYTGRSQYIDRKLVIALSIVPVISAVIGLTNAYHNLMYVDQMLVQQQGDAVMERTPGPWFWVISVYTLVLGVAGVVPFIQFALSDVETFRGQSVAIAVGALTPVCTSALYLVGQLPTSGVDPTPISFTVSGVAFLGALTRFQLFSQSPAPIQPAQQTVFDRMQEGIIILDQQDAIIDINEQAADILEQPPESVLGESIQAQVPDIAAVIDASGESQQCSLGAANRTYNVSVNEIVDSHGRVVGRIITLYDITEFVRQQQQIEVLDRVFRHNIRTRTQVIVGNADYLATKNSETKAEKIQETAMEIEALSDDIRTILDIFERGREPPEPAEATEILTDCLSAVEEQHPDVSLDCETNLNGESIDVMLREVFYNVIKNAAEHNTAADPTVWVTAAVENNSVVVVVADNGPGIDEHELALINQGGETPLEHGTGFGLAIAVWGTEYADGSISFEQREPSGLRVRVTVPTVEQGTESTDDMTAAADGSGLPD